MAPICILFVLLAFALTAVPVADGAEFYAITGLLCMKSEFIVTRDSTSSIYCAILCDQRQDCQAFTVATGPCQMFVFNKCSRNFRNCGCTDKGQVFVKGLPGLPAGGSLCPSGFANGQCGTKYKLFTHTNWNTAKAAIEAEAGLVTMADVVDLVELNYTFNLLVAKYNPNPSISVFMMLGGRQYPGSSASNKNSWYWVGCNTSVNSSVWLSGEPNDVGDQNIPCTVSWLHNGIVDAPMSISNFIGALAECASPFDD